MDDFPKDSKIAGLPQAPLRYFTMSRRSLASTQGIIMTAIRLKSFVNAVRILLGAVGLGLLLVGNASAAPPERDGVVLLLSDFETEVGDAQLVRTPNGVQINISTSGLEPYAVYTVWWVIDYGACVQWATGHPVGPSGDGQFSARLNVGDTSGDQPEGACPGLVDPQNQVIWAVLRTHGPKIPGRVYEQMGTYWGGCDPDEGDPNTCVDDQIVVFLSTL